MKQILQSPWLTVTLAIVIMTIGYTVHIVRNGEIAQASYYCPAHEICKTGECAGTESCNAEKCKSCSQCKKEATS